MFHINKIKYGFEGKDHTGKKLFNVQYKDGLCSVLKYFVDIEADIEIQYRPDNESKELIFLGFDSEKSNKAVFVSPTKSSYLEGTRGEITYSYTTKDVIIKGE